MNSPNTYYVNSNEFAGLEYDLAKLFIRELDDGIAIKIYCGKPYRPSFTQSY